MRAAEQHAAATTRTTVRVAARRARRASICRLTATPASSRFLFGGGAGGRRRARVTAQSDGVTSPAPINGNTLASELARCRERAGPGDARRDADARHAATRPMTTAASSDGARGEYYQDGAMMLPTAGTQPLAPTNVRITPGP